MTRYFFLFLIVITIAYGCNKNDFCQDITTTAPSIEVNNLRNYLTTNSITATEDSRGFFYVINNAGIDDKPTVCSTIKVSYEGKLVDGTVFDSGNNVSFLLSDLISGWQEGIPLIKKGGSITLYLPPTLGYGASGSGSIPGSSNLIFNIDLLEVN